MPIKIGADPEIFIRDNKLEMYVSAAGFFPGTKKDPFPVERGAIQVDGTALEFNIDPVENEEDFFKNIHTVYGQMEEMVRLVNPDWVLTPIPSVHFHKDMWKDIPADAKILGCDPDFNMHGNVNPNPGDRLLDQPFRTGSGHIHIGWTDDEDVKNPLHFEDARFIAEGFFKSGVYSPKTSAEFDRLVYYGGQGAFRPKKYGVELRSPSNVWLKSEQSIKEMYRKTVRTFENITSQAA